MSRSPPSIPGGATGSWLARPAAPPGGKSHETRPKLTVTGTATVAQAATWVGNSHVTHSTYSLNDSLANEAGAGPGILDGATDITATGSGDASQAQTVMSASNTGTTLIAEVVDNAANAAALVYDANDTISSLIVNSAATLAQANTWFGNGHVTASTYFIEDWYANIQAAHGQAILAHATSPGLGVPAVQADGDNTANAIDMSTQTVSVYVNALGGNDTIIGSTLAADTVNAGTGADATTLNVDTYADTIVQNFGDSQIATAVFAVGGTFGNGDFFLFGNGVDTVTSFQAGAVRDVLTGTAFQKFTATAGINGFGFGILDTNILSASVVTFQGTWNAGTQTFTLDDTASGQDTLVVPLRAGQALINSTSAIVLIGTTGLTSANFAATPVDFYATITADTQTLQVFGPAATQVSFAPGGAITGGADGPIAPFGGYNSATLTAISLATVTGGFGSAVSINGTLVGNLNSIVGTTGDDTFTFSSEDLGADTNTIDGNGGTDTIVLQAVNNSVTVGGAGAGTTFSNIDNLELATGTGANTLTIGTDVGTVNLAVSNTSATAVASVDLGGSSGVSYTTASSGDQVIWVNAANQSVTTGSGSDFIGLGKANIAYVGTFAMGTGTVDRIVMAGGDGSYDLTGATVSGVETISNDIFSNVTLVLNPSVLPIAEIDFGMGSDTLQLAAGTYSFGQFYLAFNGGGATLDLDTANTGSDVTVTMFQFGLGDVNTIIGESSSATSVTTLNMQDNTDLSTVSVSDVDVLTIGGTDQTLTVGQGQFTASNFTTVTGNSDSNLFFATAATAVDLTNTTISGFDSIDATNVTTLTIDGTSISNTALSFAAAATTVLNVNQTTIGTNWEFASGSLAEIHIASLASFSVNETILTSTLTTVQGAGTGEIFNITVSGSAVDIDMVNITNATGLGAINASGGLGCNLIATSGWDAVRSITNIILGNDGAGDIVVLDNTTIGTLASSATVTGFLAGNGADFDVISSEVAAISISNGVFVERTSGIGTVNLADHSVLAANTSWFTAVNLNNVANVLATISGNGVTGDANAAATLVVYDGLGNAGIYQLLETGGATSAFDECELVGVLQSVGNNSLTAANFI